MKFSVIIPTFKRIDFLQNAIESVNRQTYQNYEIIVVNDNPEEKSQIDDLVSPFKKVIAIHHPISKGGNAARNSGILNSSGEIIAFLDDDDIWLPDKLYSHFQKHIENPDVGLVFSDCLYVYDNDYIKDKATSSKVPVNVIDSMAKAKFCPETSSIVSIKRECVNDCGLFDDNLISFQDWDYWFRIAHLFKFAHIPLVLAHFKQHLGDRTSQNETKRREGLNQICHKWQNEINVDSFSKNFISGIYYKNSRNALLGGKKINAFKKSFKLLHTEVISFNSIKSFIKILRDIIRMRKGVQI